MIIPSRKPALRFLLQVLCFFLVGFSLQAQQSPLKQMQTIKNAAVSDTVAGIGLTVNLASPVAKNGSTKITLFQSGNLTNPALFQIKYTPNDAFVGVDTFTIELHYNAYPFLVYRSYRVSVFPSLIRTKTDYAVSNAGMPINIDPLANDFGAYPPLTLTAITLTDHCQAAILNGQILVNPEPGFSGTAHLNYQVCDAQNNCSNGTVEVGVNIDQSSANDPIQVGVKKNSNVQIALDREGYTLATAPSNGTVQIIGGKAFNYKPNPNYSGEDSFVLATNTTTVSTSKTVHVSVYDGTEQNSMAIQDIVYTTVNQPVTFNVRSNDIGNLLVKSWLTPANLQGSISSTTIGGNVTFTPNPGFSGVATFYYRIGSSYAPMLETGEVKVVVGNFQPSEDYYVFHTHVNIPLVINYKVPVTAFNFEISSSPNAGTINYYPGYSSQIIHNQLVEGYNLLVYTPNNGFQGADQFDLNYCTVSGDCKSVKVEVNVSANAGGNPPYCITECVWPGDVNRDGMVNNKDLLPLGYCMSMEGPQRPNASTQWFGQMASNWNLPFSGLTEDLKYADTDGNGTITTEDTVAISTFYHNYNTLNPVLPPAGKNLPFTFTVNPAHPAVGDYVELKVFLGNETSPVTDLYGFTFDLKLSPNIIESGFQMDFQPNSWINRNGPYLSMSKHPTAGRLESAFTRTDGIGVSGEGPIGTVGFVIIDIVDITNPPARPEFSITIDNPTALWGDHSKSSSESSTFTIPIDISSERSRETASPDAQLFVFPNPAQDRLSIHLNGVDVIQSVLIVDMTGKIQYSSGQLEVEHTSLDLSNLPNGMYSAMVQTNSGLQVRKFQILR